MALQTSAEIDNATRGARQRPSAASGGPGGLLRGEDGVTDEFCSRKRDRVWKEQTRLREKGSRPQKRKCDIADTCAASSSGRNRTLRVGLSSKPPWAPLCNRQPSNYIIIVCNYSISSNDRSPPNPAVDKQELILPSTNRRFAIEFQAVRSCRDHAAALIQLSITQQKSTRIFFSAIPLSPRLVLILLQQPP